MTTSIVTNNFLFNTAKILESSFSEENNSLYFFYGRPLPWLNEDAPPALNLSNKQEVETKSNILGLKRIVDFDISLGFKKVLWQYNRVYDVYDDEKDLTQIDYFVINDENSVYKCISNAGGSPSTVQPTDKQITGLLQTEDGYLWKYMFTVSPGLVRKFENLTIFPIDLDEDVIREATPGTVDRIDVESRGVGYSIGDINQSLKLSYVPIYVFGTGNEYNTAKIEILRTTEDAKSILSFQIEENGSGYPFTDKKLPVIIKQNQTSNGASTGEEDVTFEFAYGIADLTPSGTGISSIRLINRGQNYIEGIADVVVSGAVGYANLDPIGAIESVDMLTNGEGYTLADVLIVHDPGGSGASLRPILSPVSGHGSDPERELRANSLIFNTTLVYDTEEDFSIQNDFRTVGLISNPREVSGDGSIIANSTTLSAKTDLVFADDDFFEQFSIDETIIGKLSGARGTLIDVLPEENKIRIIRDTIQGNTIDFFDNEPIIGSISSVEKTITSINPSEYISFSGDVLFINNRRAIARASDQIESINFVLTL